MFRMFTDSAEANNGYYAWISDCLKENSLLVAVPPAFGTLGGAADNVTHYTYDSAGFIMDGKCHNSAECELLALVNMKRFNLEAPLHHPMPCNPSKTRCRDNKCR